MNPKDLWKSKFEDVLTRNNYIDIGKEFKNCEKMVNPWTGKMMGNPWGEEIDSKERIKNEVERDLAEVKEFLSAEEYENAFLEELNYRESEKRKLDLQVFCGII